MKIDKNHLTKIIDSGVLPVEIPFVNGIGLELTELLREIKGKRYVYRGFANGKSVVIKCFLGSKVREARREIEGLKLLDEAAIKTAPILWQIIDPSVAILVYQFVDGEDLSKRYQRQEFALVDKEDWFLAAFNMLKEFHQAKLIQHDIHLGNFIFNDNGLVAIDTATVRKVKHAKEFRENVALFLAQFYDCNIGSLTELIDYYCADFTDQKIDTQQFRDLLLQIQKKRFDKALSKTMRDCTQYQTISKAGYTGMQQREYNGVVAHLLDNDIDKLMENGEPLKLGNSSTVSLVEIENKAYVIKRYNQKNLLVLLKRQFRTSRAKISWLAANWLTMIGIHTPKPVAFLETNRGGLKREAYFIAEYVKGVDLEDKISSSDENSGYLVDLSYLFQMMQRYRFSHGDMKATNLLVVGSSLWVTDLDAVQLNLSQKKSGKGFRKDSQRLLKNWQDDNEISEIIKRCVNT